MQRRPPFARVFTCALVGGASSLLSCVSAVQAAGGGAVLSDPGAVQGKHFHPDGKQPSAATVQLWLQNKATLPFDDRRDFEEAKRGFLAAPPYKQIKADDGRVVWDMESYQWLLDGKDFQSIHPSLQRQAVLNMAYGLYEVAVSYTHLTLPTKA